MNENIQPINESLSASGLSSEELDLLADFKTTYEAAQRFPVGSALRAELDSRLAIIEIKLGL